MEQRVTKGADRAGLVVLLGSGETTASGHKVFDWLLRQLPTLVRLAILETPAGFELDSAQVSGQIGDLMRKHLQNYHPQVTIVPARKRGTLLSPDQPDIAALRDQIAHMGWQVLDTPDGPRLESLDRKAG